MVDIDTFLQQVFKFYHYSPLNKQGLRDAGKAVNIDVVMPVKATGTRWVQHRERALRIIIRDWSAMIQHMVQMAALGDRHRRGEQTDKAKGLLKTRFKCKVCSIYVHVCRIFSNHIIIEFSLSKK